MSLFLLPIRRCERKAFIRSFSNSSFSAAKCNAPNSKFHLCKVPSSIYPSIRNLSSAPNLLIRKCVRPPQITSLHLQSRFFSEDGTKSDASVKPAPAVADLRMAGGLAFLVLMTSAPFITKHMKQSDSTYEELETDDPVALIERIYRQENLMEHYYQYRSRLTEEGKLPQKPKTITNLVDTVTDVLSSEALKSAVASVMIQVLESSQLQKALQKLLKNLWDDLINDPETTDQVVHLLQNAIQNQIIQKAVKELVMQIVNDPEVYEELLGLLVRLGQDKKVLEATQTLLTESAHNTLNDPEVLDHSMEFATDVVGDDIIQRTSGEALRNTVSYAVRPGLATFLSVLGAMLVIFGLSTLANAGPSERDTAILEKAATTVVKNIKTGTLEGISTLLSLPFKLASSCWSLVYGLISHSLSRLGRTGNAIFHHTTVFAETILTRFLSSLGHGTKSVISSMLNSTFQLISKTWNAMTRSVENNSAAAILSVKNMFIIISTWCGASFQNICNSVVTSTNFSTQTLMWAKEEMLNKLANLCDTFIRFFTKDGNGDGSKHAF